MSNKKHCDNVGPEQNGPITRRQVLLAGGASLVGLTLQTNIFARFLGDDKMFPGVMTLSGAKKPVFVPAAGSTDPVAHSLAESLFWLDQEAEHAKFFILHMPSPELDAQRAQTQQFHNQFTGQLDKVKSARLDKGNLAAFNQSTIELVRRFIDLKQQMEKAQASGQLKSLAWPAFFEHTALEGDRFAKRLDGFSRGKVELDHGEVVDFWTRIMADHADFIAHLLDPEERMLIEKAMKTSKAWRGANKSNDVKGSLDELIAFKKTAQKGIEAGQIKSIIHPALADHVLREALKFSDELKRTESRG
ncbi:MAG TPA: DUF2935 domain-containing protein [Blastocatellia bacterium]|nr:DUF2935 domain-containing protein [Blastocatellia bacterium]